MATSPSVATVLSYMRSAIRNQTQISYPDVVEKTLQQMATAQLISPPPNRTFGIHSTLRRDDPIACALVEAFQHLLYTGLIARAPDPPNFPGNLNINQFIVTEQGRDWAAGDMPIPEDSRQYMEVLLSLVPTLDDVIRQYIEESLVVYQRRAYFAAAVMIGAACEKAIYLLADSIMQSTRNLGQRQPLGDALQKRSLPKLFEAIRETLNSGLEKIPYGVSEGTELHLLSFFDSIRVQRNEAVHPNAATVTPSKVQISLAAFPHACEKIYDLMNWLDSSPS